MFVKPVNVAESLVRAAQQPNNVELDANQVLANVTAIHLYLPTEHAELLQRDFTLAVLDSVVVRTVGAVRQLLTAVPAVNRISVNARNFASEIHLERLSRQKL